jgi:predicted DCC family thiol-disulfide oxidoreductase YuxK
MHDYPIILFDGVCNFCNGAVNFVVGQDKKKIFRFAPLQSATAQNLLAKHNLPKKDFDSFVFIDGGKAYLSSTAALRVMQKLPWYWKWIQAFWIVPERLRNGVYRFIARNRYKWFGQREQCMVPDADMRSRFL